MYARSIGTYSAVIQQLLKGKGKEVEKSTNKVGQRVGDMEVWSFQGVMERFGL